MIPPQTRQQIISDIAGRTAIHQQAIADARAANTLGQPNSPLNLLVDGDSWFDYPLGGEFPFVSRTDVIEQLPALCAQPPFILNLAHYGDTTLQEMGMTKTQEMLNAIANPANGQFDAILFSGGGNDIVGDPLPIWLNDAASVGGDPTNAINPSRFGGILGVVEASYLDLIEFRKENLPNATIFVHAYDFALPTGVGACPTVGPWLKPALNYCGWTDPAQATQIVHDLLFQFGGLMAKLESIPANNVVYVRTQGTLTAADWANELHPQPPGFVKIASKFQQALAAKYPGRI